MRCTVSLGREFSQGSDIWVGQTLPIQMLEKPPPLPPATGQPLPQVRGQAGIWLRGFDRNRIDVRVLLSNFDLW